MFLILFISPGYYWVAYNLFEQLKKTIKFNKLKQAI